MSFKFFFTAAVVLAATACTSNTTSTTNQPTGTTVTTKTTTMGPSADVDAAAHKVGAKLDDAGAKLGTAADRIGAKLDEAGAKIDTRANAKRALDKVGHRLNALGDAAAKSADDTKANFKNGVKK